jgi:hypothetical protein
MSVCEGFHITFRGDCNINIRNDHGNCSHLLLSTLCTSGTELELHIILSNLIFIYEVDSVIFLFEIVV